MCLGSAGYDVKVANGIPERVRIYCFHDNDTFSAMLSEGQHKSFIRCGDLWFKNVPISQCHVQQIGKDYSWNTIRPEYDCITQDTTCSWRITSQFPYRYSSIEKIWIRHNYYVN